MAFTPNGADAYVTDKRDGTVSVIDTRTFSVTPVVIGRDTSPTGVAITSDGTRAYVTDQTADSVSVINTGTLAVTTPITGIQAPRRVAISPDGSAAYVTGGGFPGAVSVIDTGNDTVTRTVAADNVPDYVAFTPDGGKAFVTNGANTSVSVINTETFAVTNVFGFTAPAGVAITDIPSPALVLTKNLTGRLTPGRTAAYTLTLTDTGSGPTDGSTVTVTDTLPAPLRLVAMTGPGWTCHPATSTCTRSDVLGPHQSYAPITLTVAVPCTSGRGGGTSPTWPPSPAAGPAPVPQPTRPPWVARGDSTRAVSSPSRATP